MSLTRNSRRSGSAGFLRDRWAIEVPARVFPNRVFSFENAKKLAKQINMVLTIDFFPLNVTTYAFFLVFESSVIRNYGTRSDQIVSSVLKLDILTC